MDYGVFPLSKMLTKLWLSSNSPSYSFPKDEIRPAYNWLILFGFSVTEL